MTLPSLSAKNGKQTEWRVIASNYRSRQQRVFDPLSYHRAEEQRAFVLPVYRRRLA